MPTSYRDEQRERWDSLAAAHGSTEPLRAVIGSTPLGNDYLDRTTKRFLGKLLRLKTSDVVLDYGCGVGRLAVWLAPQVREVVAMDISPKMVDVATAESAARGIGNARFSVADGYRLPLETASVDVVICGSVLKYVLDDDDLGVLVDEFGRVLRVGGRVAVIEEIDEDGPTVLHGPEEIGETSRLRPASEYRELFARHGMTAHGHWAVYRQRILRIYKRLDGSGKPPAWLAAVLVRAEIGLEGLLRSRVNSPRGFWLLYFKRDPERAPHSA
jgi:ubiquinone/menaquinone biosynthesis C-methylase UbiE